MSAIQTLLKGVLPKRWGDRLETESRTWIFQCPECANEKSLWDAGGMRLAATGESRVPGHCGPCGKMRLLRLYRRP